MTLPAIDTKEDDLDDSFIWRNNTDVQKLLDLVVNILVTEYVQAVRNNPNLFSTNGDSK
jgi:hypothetical protein